MKVYEVMAGLSECLANLEVWMNLATLDELEAIKQIRTRDDGSIELCNFADDEE